MMIPIVEKYEYKHLERITDPLTGIRHYIEPSGKALPSVTTILGATKNDSGLAAWRAFKGDVEADRIVKEATNIGSMMHLHLENWLQNIERPGGSNFIRQLTRKMSDLIIDNGMPKVSEVWGIEAPLYYPGLYAGTTDLCGLYNGEPAIMDYKSANKMKTEAHVQDYFCQGAAYCLAHNEIYGTNIRRVVLFMASRDLEYKEWVLEGDAFDKKVTEWLSRVETYYNEQDKGK